MCHAMADRHTLGLVEILLFWWSPVCQVQIFSDHVAFLVKMLGRCLETFICVFWYVLSLILTLPCRSFLPGVEWWSVSCVGSKTAFLCAVVLFPTCLTRWVDNSWFLAFLLFVAVVVVVAFRVILCCTAVAFASTSLGASNLFFLSLELTSLIAIVPWLFTVMAYRFGFLRLVFVACRVTVFIWNSSAASKPLIF